MRNIPASPPDLPAPHDFSELERVLLEVGGEVRLRTVLGNLGDAVIHVGERRLLDRLGIQLVEDDRRQELPLLLSVPGAVVAPQYPYAGKVLDRVLHESSEIVVLPSTMRGFGPMLRRVSGLQAVFSREPRTEKYLQRLGLGSLVHRAHDVAFELERTEIPSMALEGARPSGALLALRKDRETMVRIGSLAERSFDVSGQRISTWENSEEAEQWVAAMFRFIASFEQVVTDRLHVAVVASMLGRECWFLPGAYWKNHAVWEASLADSERRSHFVAQPSDIPGAVLEVVADDAAARWSVFSPIEAVADTPPQAQRLRGVSRIARERARRLTTDPRGVIHTLVSDSLRSDYRMEEVLGIRQLGSPTSERLGGAALEVVPDGLRWWKSFGIGRPLHTAIAEIPEQSVELAVLNPSVKAITTADTQQLLARIAPGGLLACPGYFRDPSHVELVDEMFVGRADLSMRSGQVLCLCREVEPE